MTATDLSTFGYTVTDAMDAVADFERAVVFKSATARNVIARLVGLGAEFMHFEFNGWRDVVCSGRVWSMATFTVDAEVGGVPVSVRVSLSRGRSAKFVETSTVDVGTRMGGRLDFTANGDLTEVRAARVALGMSATP